MRMQWGKRGARELRAAGLIVAAIAAAPALAGDPVRGEQLFRTPPRPGDLACADCHSENPQLTNFGGIWAGRNAPAVIQRAIQNNTGGMGYFLPLYRAAELADIAAWLGNTPARLIFASTAQGTTSAAQPVIVSSSLKQPLTGLSVTVEGDYVVLGSTCRATLPALSSCRVDVAFRPGAEGDRAGALLLAHSGSTAPVRIPLSGSSPLLPRAVAGLTPARLDFSSTPLGAESVARHALLTNDSADVLTIRSLAATPSDFGVSGGSCVAGQRLRPGERCVIALRFTPRSGGERRGTLTVLHDGVGGASVLALAGSAGSGLDERLQAEPRALDFGTLAPGQRSEEHTLVWTQMGSSSLSNVPVSVGDPRFSLSHNGCTGAVAPFTRCELRLRFTPTRAVATSAELRIGSLRVPLHGRGLTSGSLVARPLALRFDEVVGTSGVQRLQLVNDGLAPLRVGALSIGGPEAGEFTIDAATTDCQTGRTLAAGASCAVALRFTPAATGVRVARLQVEHDGAGAAGATGPAAGLVAELTGEAVATARSQPWPALNHIDLGVLTPGASRERRLRVENRGRAVLRWHVLALSGDAALGAGTAAPAAWQRIDEPLAGTCAATREVAPQAACEVPIRFSAGAPATGSGSTSAATLVLWPVDRAAPVLVSLRAQVAPGGGSWPGVESSTSEAPLAAAPVALVFEAVVGRDGAPAVPLLLRNDGAQPLRLAELTTSDTPFVLDPGACVVGALLMPGDQCTAALRWTGAAASASATLRAQADQPGASVVIPVSITEDPAQRSNEGGARGGGALRGGVAALWLVAFAVAVASIVRRQRAD